MERDEEHFDLDDEFVAGAEEENYDRFIDRVDRRKQAAAVKKGKAAWSKLEDVLAEKRLQKELSVNCFSLVVSQIICLNFSKKVKSCSA